MPDYLQNVKFHFDNIHKWDPLHFGPVILHQIGEVICDLNFENGLHQQECYEFSYIASGQGTCFTQGKYYNVHQGDVFIARVGALHNIKTDNRQPLRMFYCGFMFDETDPQFAAFRPLKELLDTSEVPLASDSFNMFTIFTNIFNEYTSLNAMREVVLGALLTELLCAVYRNFKRQIQSNYVPDDAQSASESLFYSVIQYMEQNIVQIRQLKEISDHFGYTYSYISHICSKKLNKTLKEYYNELKLSKAREFLDHGLSATEISDMLGYASIHSFSRFFRQQYGVSPQQYKKGTDKQWELTFSDEFPGYTLDETKWEPCPERAFGDGSHWRRAHHRVENGRLLLSIAPEAVGCGSGAVWTFRKFEQHQGYFEVQCRLPTRPGWSLSMRLVQYADRPVPDDEARDLTIELVNAHAPDERTVAHAVSWTAPDGVPYQASQNILNPSLFEGTHTFGVWWQDGQLLFYIDRKKTWQAAMKHTTAPLFLQLATNRLPTSTQPTPPTDQAEITYIKAYRQL